MVNRQGFERRKKLRAKIREIFATIQFKIFCRPGSSINTFKTIILPVVLYGRETWSLTLGEEHRLRTARMGCWREYLDLRGKKWQDAGEGSIMRSFITRYTKYCQGDQIKEVVMDVACSRHTINEIYIQNFSRKVWRTRPLWIRRRRWEDNVRITVREIWWEGVAWMHLVNDINQWWALLTN
jgi:hypothetical protein